MYFALKIIVAEQIHLCVSRYRISFSSVTDIDQTGYKRKFSGVLHMHVSSWMHALPQVSWESQDSPSCMYGQYSKDKNYE